MQIKQNFNGTQGEDRTRQILGKNFIYNIKSVDIDGIDFEVELLPENGTFELKDKIQVRGRIQAKYFEKNNEVKIAKEYVEDNEGIRTEFFALLHTDNDENENCYFFSAKDVKELFKQRKDSKTGKENYIFSLSKNRQFEKFKSFSKNEINKRIEEGIRNTEEYRNQKFLQTIEAKFIKPVQKRFENSNLELFQNIKNKHIVDKLYTALNEYKDFRRITSWRLIDKISFYEDSHTSTYFNQFSLHTNNREILGFFENITIDNSVTIINESYFNEVAFFKDKTNKIIEILNQNLICKLDNQRTNKTTVILKKPDVTCDCMSCQFNNLEFHKVYNLLYSDENYSDDLWDWMQSGYILFKFGEYDKAKIIISKIKEKAKQNKQEVIYFLANYNSRAIAWKTWENEHPDLNFELSNLVLSTEKKKILESISKGNIFNDYANAIDDIYLKVKDFKQRRNENDTASLVNRIYSKFVEYINFIDGNWIVLNSFEEFNAIVEKVIETCIVSYSMKSEYYNHIKFLDDYLIQFAIHYCDPNKLLGYFQRNGVVSISYESNNKYFENCLINFFTKENVDFLYPEICYFDNRTKNPEFRRKIEKIFNNLCILLTYLDIKVNTKNLLKNISYFIEKLDFNIHDISILAHPLLRKPNLFETDDILLLIKVIISKDKLIDGYLLTNCLIVLQEKEFVFKTSEKDIVESIINASINNPRYNLIKVIPNILSKRKSKEYKQFIQDSLNIKFNHELYYQAVVNGCLVQPKINLDSYLNFYSTITKNKTTPSLFNNASPYTGINEPLRQNLNNLIEVIFVINDKNLLQNPIIQKIIKYNPYLNFILNIDNFNSNASFDKLWILENQSEIVLKTISKNKYLKVILKEELLKQYHKEIANIFIMYFTD